MVAENFAYDLLDVEDRLVDAEQRAESYRFAYQQAVHRLAAVERDLRTARGTLGALREELRATRRGSAA
jgi:septation ring formation regulator EzrA